MKVKLESTSSSSSEESFCGSEDLSGQPANMGLEIGSPMDSTSEEAVSPKASSSSGSDISSKHKPSPVKLKTGYGEPLPKITWQPKKKALSSSDGSDESSSGSDEDAVKRRWHTQNESLSAGRGKIPSLSKFESALQLPSDASAEDLFDWTILGLQGPWMPLTPEDKISGTSELKEQFIQLKFPSHVTYISTFQKLIAEEAKPILCSEWNQYTAQHDSHGGSARESSNADVFASDSRGLSTQRRLRNMVQTGSDPFHYIEAEWVEGPIQSLSAREFLCMVLPKTSEIKGLAIVNCEEQRLLGITHLARYL